MTALQRTKKELRKMGINADDFGEILIEEEVITDDIEIVGEDDYDDVMPEEI